MRGGRAKSSVVLGVVLLSIVASSLAANVHPLEPRDAVPEVAGMPMHVGTTARCSVPPRCLTSRGPARSPAAAEPAGSVAGAMLAWSELRSSAPVGTLGAGTGMVVDPASASAFAFGGEEVDDLVNSTLSYSEVTNSWTVLTATHAPTPRSNFAFGFDTSSGDAVLFGGLVNLTTSAVTNDTWTYDPTSDAWTNHSSSGPAPRENPAFAVDPGSGIGLLFGGENPDYESIGTITYSDLWELNLSTFVWRQIVPSAGPQPPPLEGAAMTWDSSSGEFQMFGGCAPCLNDVWEFDPVTQQWSELPVGSDAPAPVAEASWTFDPLLNADLLFGGTDGTTAYGETLVFYPSNDTWIAQTLPGPTARWSAASAYLDVSGNATWLLAGGATTSGPMSDLWRLSATSDLGIRVENASAPQLPIGDANVSLNGRGVGFTNSEGYLNLTQINGVDSTLTVSVTGYFSNTTTLWLAPGSSAQRTVFLTVIPPQDLATIHVSVQGDRSLPIVDGYVNLTINGTRFNAQPVLTGSTGLANFTRVPPGVFNISVGAADWRPNYTLGTVAPGAVVSVTVELVSAPFIQGNVTGRLPWGVDVPLQGVTIYLNGAPFFVTRVGGEISEETAAYGPCNLTAYALGYNPASETVTVPWTGEVNVTVVLDSLPVGSLYVKVLDRSNNQPLALAVVDADSSGPLPSGWSNSSAKTNYTGWANVSLLEGYYEVSAIASGFLSSEPVVVHMLPSTNRTITISLVPEPGANISFRVQNSVSLAPISDATVSISNLGSGVTNASGYFNVSGIAPGSYVVSTSAVGYESNVTVLTFAFYENATVPINLTPLVPVSPSPSHDLFQFLSGNPGALWALLIVPGLLALGGFVYLMATRAGRDDDETEEVEPAPGASDPAGVPLEFPR